MDPDPYSVGPYSVGSVNTSVTPMILAALRVIEFRQHLQFPKPPSFSPEARVLNTLSPILRASQKGR